jgi:hypothetical protein
MIYGGTMVLVGKKVKESRTTYKHFVMSFVNYQIFCTVLHRLNNSSPSPFERVHEDLPKSLDDIVVALEHSSLSSGSESMTRQLRLLRPLSLFLKLLELMVL